MICILDKEDKNFNQPNFIAMDSEKIILPELLSAPTHRFINIAHEIGLYCPSIRIHKNKERLYLKYDNIKRFVVFTITNNQIEYTFGELGSQNELKSGFITDLRKQLKSLHDYIYGELE